MAALGRLVLGYGPACASEQTLLPGASKVASSEAILVEQLRAIRGESADGGP